MPVSLYEIFLNTGNTFPGAGGIHWDQCWGWVLVRCVSMPGCPQGQQEEDTRHLHETRRRSETRSGKIVNLLKISSDSSALLLPYIQVFFNVLAYNFNNSAEALGWGCYYRAGRKIMFLCTDWLRERLWSWRKRRRWRYSMSTGGFLANSLKLQFMRLVSLLPSLPL